VTQEGVCQGDQGETHEVQKEKPTGVVWGGASRYIPEETKGEERGGSNTEVRRTRKGSYRTTRLQRS